MADHKYPGEYVHDGIVFFDRYPAETIEAIKDFETDISDICIASYPKCGSTWMRQILKLLHPELYRKEEPLLMCVPLVESNDSKGVSIPNVGNGLKTLQSRKPPRLMKTHLPFKYWRRQVEGNRLKVILLVRNVKDVLVSYYHHHIVDPNIGFTDYTFDAHFRRFRSKSLSFGDFFESVQSWLNVRNRSNVMLIRYEDMKADLIGEMLKISAFCDKNYTRDEIAIMAKECEFDVMQKSSIINVMPGNAYVRKGLVGEWKKYFTEEQSQYMDDIILQWPDYKKLYENN